MSEKQELMESCWLIEFTNGDKIILSEYMYKKEKERNFAGRKLLCKQHWFDYKACRARNNGVPTFGFV